MSTEINDDFVESPQIDPATDIGTVDNDGNSTVSASSGRIKNMLLLILLAVLAAVALAEFCLLGLSRRTFVFYTDTGAMIVEQRMLRVFGRNPWASGESLLAVGKKPTETLSREINITRYVEEALLGPVSPDSLPLFPRETRLHSLLYRDGVVYADLSQDAAVPLPGGEVFRNLETLYFGIKRNFPYVREIRFFIAGKAAYAEQFGQTGEFPAKSEI
jgi:hypothetical protein